MVQVHESCSRHLPVVFVHGSTTAASRMLPSRKKFLGNGYSDAELYATTYGTAGNKTTIEETLACDYVKSVRQRIYIQSLSRLCHADRHRCLLHRPTLGSMFFFICLHLINVEVFVAFAPRYFGLLDSSPYRSGGCLHDLRCQRDLFLTWSASSQKGRLLSYECSPRTFTV